MYKNMHDEDENEPNGEGLLSKGELSLNDLDDANIPVDIWLAELTEDDELYSEGYRFSLKCGNYMPRKGRVEESAVEVYAKNREDIQKAVAKYILPLYQTALKIVTKMVNEGKGDLYYWMEDENVSS